MPGRPLISAAALDDPDARIAVHAAARSAVARIWLGQLGEASELLEAARRRLTGTSDDFLAGQVESATGMLCAYQGRSSQAIVHYRAALDLFRRSGVRRDEAMALENLGNRHLERGSVAEAEDYLLAALGMFQELGEIRLEAHTLGDVGVLHCELGRFDEAERVLSRALTLSGRVGDRHWEGILSGFPGGPRVGPRQRRRRQWSAMSSPSPVWRKSAIDATQRCFAPPWLRRSRCSAAKRAPTSCSEPRARTFRCTERRTIDAPSSCGGHLRRAERTRTAPDSA